MNPKPGTLLASVVEAIPSQGFAGLDEIRRRVGRNESSILTIVMRAARTELLERQNPRHVVPQGYRLTDRGRALRYELERR